MLKIITSDEILREYFPNTLVTVDDEVTFFDRISSYLITAEEWVKKQLLGNSLFDAIAVGSHDTMFVLVARIIVNDSLSRAVPSLDLILTPNGFGVVNNNTIAPASKDRIDRLIQSLIFERNFCIQELLHLLRTCTEWHGSEQCHWLASSLIQSLDDDKSPENGGLINHWEEFIKLRQNAERYERELMRCWIGSDLLNALRYERATASSSSPIRYDITFALRNIVVRAVRCQELDTNLLTAIVDKIREMPDSFPEWHNHEIASYFNPPIFLNEKTSSGYMF